MILEMADRARLEQGIRMALWASRHDADITQQQLAEKLGWSRNQVANVESGRRQIQVIDLLLFAKALNVSPMTLLNRILHWCTR